MPVNPLGGEPPTGEPDAGDPHVRFGGGRGWELNQLFLPLSATASIPYLFEFLCEAL